MKPSLFFGCAVIAGVFGVVQAVSHQHHANHLASAVVAADQAGQDTTGSQAAVQAYVHVHMSVSETVFLAGSYNRAAAAAQTAANPASNGQIYAQAQAACAGHTDSITQANCVQAYVNSHAAPSSNPQAIAAPAKSAYTKKYAAPSWTPDSTGIAFVVMLGAVAAGFCLTLLRR